MNALRTLQAREKEWWMRLLTKRGPHRGRMVPSYPPRLPLPFKPRPRLEGGYVYVVYRRAIFAYGRISEVRRHPGTRVGTRQQAVRPGYELCVDGPMKRFPCKLACRGFRNLRYSPLLLHRLSPAVAHQTIAKLRLTP